MKLNTQPFLLTVVVALLSMSSFAAGADNTKIYTNAFLSKQELKDGLYIGMQAGHEVYSVRDNLIVGDDDLDIFKMNPSLSATGWVGGLFAGYGHYFKNIFYLGTEIFVNSTNADTSYVYSSLTNSGLDADIVDVKFQVNNSYGVTLLPGIKLTSAFLLYARLGWNWVSIKAQQTLTSDAGGVFPNNEIITSFSNSKRINGFSYGVGMESSISEHCSLRGEYIHTNYASFSSYGFFTIPWGSKFSPSDNQFMLGLIYHLA